MSQGKVYILLGPPGSGKGTQAKKVAPYLGLPHISLGDLLREAVANKTEVGLKVEKFLKAGELVPDTTVIEVAKERVAKDDCKNGFVLDGFPRTMEQAKVFESNLDKLGFKQEKAIYIDLPLKELIGRLTERRSCKKCGAVYHSVYIPPQKKGICDKCGGELYQRHDDEESVIKNRYEIYKKQTMPLIEHYKKLNILVAIDGKKQADEVFKSICGNINKA